MKASVWLLVTVMARVAGAGNLSGNKEIKKDRHKQCKAGIGWAAHSDEGAPASWIPSTFTVYSMKEGWAILPL